MPLATELRKLQKVTNWPIEREYLVYLKLDSISYLTYSTILTLFLFRRLLLYRK